MPTAFPDLFAALSRPFEAFEVKTRQAPGGRQLSYVTARTVMNRLDDVLGPENWWDTYLPMENSVLCKLTIRLPDGSLVTKCDAGGYAGMVDQGDDDKSGYSDAYKRAAAKFGPGRYLYRDGVPDFVRQHYPDPGSHSTPTSPSPSRPTHGSVDSSPPAPPSNQINSHRVPTSGKALFAWTKDQEQRHEVGLLKYLSSWAKLQDFPARMVDWDADQVARAHAEAVRKLEAIHPKPDSQPEPPASNGAPVPHSNGHSVPPSNGSGGDDGPPTSGKALFPWAKEQGRRAGKDVVKFLNEWAAENNIAKPNYFPEWSESEVARGVAAAIGFLGGQPSGSPRSSGNNVEAILARQITSGTEDVWNFLADLGAALNFPLTGAWRKEMPRLGIVYDRAQPPIQVKGQRIERAKGFTKATSDFTDDDIAKMRAWAVSQVDALKGRPASPVNGLQTNAPDSVPPDLKHLRNRIWVAAKTQTVREGDDDSDNKAVFRRVDAFVDAVSSGESIRLFECNDVTLLTRVAESAESWLAATANLDVPIGEREPGMDDEGADLIPF